MYINFFLALGLERTHGRLGFTSFQSISHLENVMLIHGPFLPGSLKKPALKTRLPLSQLYLLPTRFILRSRITKTDEALSLSRARALSLALVLSHTLTLSRSLSLSQREVSVPLARRRSDFSKTVA